MPTFGATVGGFRCKERSIQDDGTRPDSRRRAFGDVWCDVDEGRDTRNTSQGGKNAKTAIRRYSTYSSTTQLLYSTVQVLYSSEGPPRCLRLPTY